jgi:hypothetical protein
MDFADGESFRTKDTVVWESLRCSASMRRLTCPGGSDLLVFAMEDKGPFLQRLND